MFFMKKIAALSAVAAMVISMSSVGASAAYDKEKTIYGNSGEVQHIKNGQDYNRIYLIEYYTFDNKTNEVQGYMTGGEYDQYYTFKSAYRLNGHTYDSTSGKNNTDERETKVKKPEHWFTYTKYAKGKKMNWANMRGYTYMTKKDSYTNKVALKLTIK